MNIIKPDNIVHKQIVFNALFTFAYIGVLYVATKYTNHIYDIGKYSSWPIIATFVVAESIKLCYGIMQPDYVTGRETKQTKVKKCYKRLKIKEFVKVIMFMGAMIAIFFMVSILLGAPLLAAYEETMMFSLLITSLAIFPICINLGVDSAVALIFGNKSPNMDKISELLYQNMILTIFGAWCGSTVIPLDWDRPWQVWPVPCSFGAIAGNVFSHCFILVKMCPSFYRRFVKKNKKVR